MAFLTSAKAHDLLIRFTQGRLNAAEAPAWMAPLFDTKVSSIESIADKAVEASKRVSRFGLEGLRFNARLDDLVAESHQLAAAVEEMAASASEIEGYAKNVLDRAEQSEHEAKNGELSLASLVTKLGAIERSFNQVGEHASAFVEKTTDIIKLTSTVNEIADQTNLLALNAAIEAARAGEHGRGFSVVADEVRGLAHRSAEAAREIESIVSDVVRGASEIDSIIETSVDSLAASQEDRDKLMQTIESAYLAAQNNVQASTQVASAASQQSAVAGDMARQVHELDNSTQESAEIFHRISTSISDIRDNQYAMLKDFDGRDDKMLLRLAKSDHIIWVDKVIRFVLFGEQSLAPDELKSHLECRLGKFLGSQKGQSYKSHSRFEFLFSDAHPKVHQTGIEIYRLAQSKGNREELEQQVQALIKYSDQVLDVLDELINS